MRNSYLVTYDVCDDKRLRHTYRKMCGFGDPLQYSVFYCELSLVERQLLREALHAILRFDEDRVMIVDLGPVGGRADECIEHWGSPRVTPSCRTAVII